MNSLEDMNKLDEAIKHERELVNDKFLQGMLCHANPDDEELDKYIECGKVHEQYAIWLEELKKLRSLVSTLEEFFADFSGTNDIKTYEGGGSHDTN